MLCEIVYQSDIYIADTGTKGRGVFTNENFEPGDIIEVCPVILMSNDDYNKVQETVLDDYISFWSDETSEYAIFCGYGSFYNHSYHPNTIHTIDEKNKCIVFKALTPIKKGEELTVNYNGDPSSLNGVWFTVID